MPSPNSFSEDDDGHTLSLLLLPSTCVKGREALTAKLFDNLFSRFVSDTTSHVCSTSGGNDIYWDGLLKTARTNGFQIECCRVGNGNDNGNNNSVAIVTTESCTAGSIDTLNLPAEFQTEKGKVHLAAVCSLLGVSPLGAVSITTSAVESMESNSKSKSKLSEYSRQDVDKALLSGNTDENDGTETENKNETENENTVTTAKDNRPSLSSLLGTRMLLLLVRNFHYQQKIARVRFITESIRGEKQDLATEDSEDVVERSIKDLTVKFLNRLDDRTTLSFSSGKSNRRGLFHLLLSLACAPAKNLGPNMIFPSSSLTPSKPDHDGNSMLINDIHAADSGADTNTDINTHTYGYADLAMYCTLPSHDFSRHLMEEHMTLYDNQLRTEALEALFALLYERIEGGVNRGDYMLLSSAFHTQKFFTTDTWDLRLAGRNDGKDDARVANKQRSQLSALIMAESLSLWRFNDDNSALDSNSNSISNSILSHPFLTGDEGSLRRELQFIGKELLLEKFASKIPQRRRIALSDTTNQTDEVNVEVPESIALLTFGVILKLASKKNMPATTTLSPFMKELGFKCVSVANDQCGAFAYLQSIMSNLLRSSTVDDTFGSLSQTIKDEHYFDWTFYALQNCNDPIDGENGDGEFDEKHDKQDGGNAVTIAYASIGREILVGTLTAFKSSLLCNSTSSKEDNIGMFCNLAAQIYQNNSVLCDSFWVSWDHYCSNRPTTAGVTVFEDIAIGTDTDSLCHLLDAAHMLASNSLTTHIVDKGGCDSKWMNGNLSASMLPSLMPLLRLISSIIPSHGGNVCDVISTFFLENMAPVCLQGCFYLCSLNNTKIMNRDAAVVEEHDRLLQAALSIMTSLHTIARVMSKDGHEQGIELLQNALEPTDNVNGESFVVSSPALLYNIANFSLHNVNFNKKQRVVLASSALGTMTELLRCETANDFLWASQVGKCLCQNISNGMSVGFGLFVEEGMEEVTALSMALLQKMSMSVTEFVIGSTQENILLDYLTTVGDGAHTACRLLPLTLASSTEHHRIAFGAISSIYILIRALAGIMEWHEIQSVKSKAKHILGELIQTLSSSSTLQGALGYYATLPMAVGIASITQTHDEFIAASKGRASDVKSGEGLMQNDESFSRSTFSSLNGGRLNGIKQDAYLSFLIQQVGRIPLPYENDSKMRLTVFKIAKTSMSLLLLWGTISERFAIEEHTESLGCLSLPEALNDIDVKNIQNIKSNLQSNGPVRILLSCPVPPVTENIPASHHWPASRIHVLNLITRYVGWCSEDDNGPSNLKTDLAVKAVKLISMGMIHSNLSESWKKPVKIGSNSLLDSIHPTSISSMGSQVQIAHLKLLQNLPRGRECGEFSQRKSGLTLHLLNMLSRSVVFLPTLAKHILSGQGISNGCKLTDLIIETLLPARMSSPTVALIASSCADVLHQLWNSCRDNCAIFRESKSPVLLHPCDSIFASLYSKHTVVKTCSLALLNHRSMMNQVNIASLRHNEDMVEKPASAYIKSAILNIMSKSLQILGKESILFMREDVQQSATTVDMQNFLKRVNNKNLIEELYQSMNCFDGAIFSARSIKSLQILSSSSYKFVNAIWNNMPLAIEVVSAFPKSDENKVLSNALVIAHSAEYVILRQANLLSSLSQFGQIAALLDEENSLESASYKMIDQAMIPIRQSAENSFIAFSLVPSSQRRFIAVQTLDVAYELTSSLASHLSELLATPPGQAHHLVGILEDLLRSSERYLTIVESPTGIQSQHTKYLVCRLRLNVLLSALLLVNAIKATEKLSHEERKRLNSNRLGLCRLIGDTLNSLAFAKPDGNAINSVAGSGSALFPYDFSSETADNMSHQMTDIRGVSLNLLRIAISLLSALLPTTINTSPSFSSNACETELAITFRNCDLVSLVLRHLESASDAAASTYQMALDEASYSGKSLQSTCIHKNSVDMIARIFHFAYCIADFGGKELPILMLENRFVQSLTKCKILTHACQQWSALTTGDGTTRQRERGYLKIKRVTRFVSAKDLIQMNHSCRIPDPVHNIWRSSVQILTALIRSCNSSNFGSLENMNKQCYLAIIDFISTFEDCILSCIQNCSFRIEQEAPSSEFGFTVNLLKEVCDILSLLSELCNEENRQQFEIASVHFYRKVGLAALDIMKTLSTFMGAVGIARELFSILSNLNKLIAGDGNGDDESTASRHDAFITHPLMADGVSNAKHEEIRNALYASSCCISMTDDEYALSQSKMKSSAISLIDKTGSSMNLGQMCQNHLDNDFTLLIEGIVSQCVFNALSVIEKVHPAASCFICFDENEAFHLNLSSTPPSGAIVAIRPHATAIRMSSYLCVSDVRYGRVVDYNTIKRTLDVQYFYSSKFSKAVLIEKGIPLLRLAGIEDISKRKSMLDVYAAPNSVSDTTANVGTSSASLGDLIQILRWCCQHDLVNTKKNNANGIQKELVKGIAESASMFLGNEVGMHLELGSFTCISEDNMKELNRQILGLFDDEEPKISMSSFEAESSSIGLRSFIDDDVWKGVLQQVDNLLSSGRVEREKIRKALDDNGAHLLSWGRTIQKGERRSPFKMTFVKR